MPGLRKASSRRRTSRRSKTNVVVMVKIVASGKKVIFVPVLLADHRRSPSTVSGSVVMPRSKPMA